ncbi:MAG TPA: hypothetical protein VMF67_15840, partial [Rhizomicrobium sp.]|nr:hypothetical protein [Rhizomicrobium sp.]
MQDKKHKTKGLNFGGFSGYYGPMSGHDGYGGFDYVGDVSYMNASIWTKANGPGYELGWCDTGYQNIAQAAHTKSLGWIYEYGLMETASKHTFTLESFLATASWSYNQPWEVISYTEKNGALVQKGTMNITPTFSKAETITFKGKDWTGIAAIAFEIQGDGSAGNTCTYGTARYGYEMCIDKVKVKFAKKADLKHNASNLLTPYQLHHHTAAAHVAAASQGAHDAAAAHAGDVNSTASH